MQIDHKRLTVQARKVAECSRSAPGVFIIEAYRAEHVFQQRVRPPNFFMIGYMLILLKYFFLNVACLRSNYSNISIYILYYSLRQIVPVIVLYEKENCQCWVVDL